MEPDSEIDPLEPLKRDPEEYRIIIKKLLELESERLYQRQPHLNDDIIRIIKEVIR